MAERIVVYWRDIPAQVIVRQGRSAAKRELPPRFAEAIDRAAMRAGLTGTESYLEAWRRGPPTPCGADLDREVTAAVADLEQSYPSERLRRLVESAGRDGAEPV
jgi:hypothetical protein